MKDKLSSDPGQAEGPVRLDRWLWACRFFKTRSLAKQAIEGGKVRVDQQRCKPGKLLKTGMTVEVVQGWNAKTVLVRSLSEQRRGASEAEKLYEETPQSIELRESRRLQRKADLASGWRPAKRPNKRERRQIHQFTRGVSGDESGQD